MPAIRDRLRGGGVELEDDTKIEGVDRLFACDSLADRLELGAA